MTPLRSTAARVCCLLDCLKVCDEENYQMIYINVFSLGGFKILLFSDSKKCDSIGPRVLCSATFTLHFDSCPFPDFVPLEI